MRSKRWSDLRRDPRVAVVIDGGEQFHELRGVEISGVAEVVGEVPRTATPDSRVATAELLFARKYMGGDHFTADGRHAWLRIAADQLGLPEERCVAAVVTLGVRPWSSTLPPGY